MGTAGDRAALVVTVVMSAATLAVLLGRTSHLLGPGPAVRETHLPLQVEAVEQPVSGTPAPSAAPSAAPTRPSDRPHLPSPPPPPSPAATTTLAPLPTALASPASSSLLARGKIDPTSTATACPATVPRERINNTITFYVQNPRTGSLFMSNRLSLYGSGKYTYQAVRTKTLVPRPTSSVAAFLDEVCVRNPGFKVFVYDSAGSPNWWLSNWPANSVLVMTGDESGRWGLNVDGRDWGPFGDDKESFFPHNASSPYKHIVLPPTIQPFFRQYYDARQAEVFGAQAVYMPLGSRSEFPDLDPRQAKPADQRRFIFSLMASATDNSRKRLHDILLDARFPADRRFLHMASKWHPDLSHEEYVPPSRYAQIMGDSIFVPCPKGHSIETFRFYEAIEAGAIPVVELDDKHTQAHLPPEYRAAPILFVEHWEELPDRMLALLEDTAVLRARQRQLVDWYYGFMRGKALFLEELLERRFAMSARV